jgi:hypothetical protein
MLNLGLVEKGLQCMATTVFLVLLAALVKILSLVSFAEPRHFDATPAPGYNFDEALAAPDRLQPLLRP